MARINKTGSKPGQSCEKGQGDMLTLSMACGYVERLLSNVRVEKHHSDILRELRALLADVKQKDKSSEAAA